MLPGLPPDSGVRQVLELNPLTGAILSSYHEALLRGPSPLSIADRELIAAFVSGLNECRYCFGTHAAAAEAFGVPDGLIFTLVNDPELKAATPKMRPLLEYARKLTLRQTDINVDDVNAVFAVGWDERALHDAICIACTFNFMNRLVHGHRIEGSPENWAERGRYLHEFGYGGLVRAADIGVASHGT